MNTLPWYMIRICYIFNEVTYKCLTTRLYNIRAIPIALLQKVAHLMPLNTCKIKLQKDEQAITSKGVFSTNDVELHISMLTCAR